MIGLVILVALDDRRARGRGRGECILIGTDVHLKDLELDGELDVGKEGVVCFADFGGSYEGGHVLGHYDALWSSQRPDSEIWWVKLSCSRR
jgi:hypothetical protein